MNEWTNAWIEIIASRNDFSWLVGWIMTSPKDIQILIPKCYLIWQKWTLQMWLKILRWRDYPGLSWWALNAIICILTTGRQRDIWYTQKRRRQCDLKDSRDWSDKVATNWGMLAATGSWKRHEQILPQSLWREHHPADTLIWASETDFELLASRTVRE